MKASNQLEKTIERLRNNDTTLTTLSLSGNDLGPDSAKALADAIERNTTLTTLNLFGNDLGPPGVRALAEALQHNSTLTTLDLGYNTLKPGSAFVLAEALLHNSTLTTLGLGGNNLGPDGATALGKALERNTSLTTLDLASNQLGPGGATALAEALERNSTLTALNLGNNDLGLDDAKALVQALERNTTLRTLILLYNEIGPDDATALAKALERNEYLAKALTDVKILLAQPHLTNEEVAKLSDTLQRAEDIYLGLPAESHGAKNLRQQLDELTTLAYLRTHRLLEACLAFSKLTAPSLDLRYSLALELLGQGNLVCLSPQEKGQLCFMLLRDCPQALSAQYQALCVFRDLPFSSAPATLAEILQGHSYLACALEPVPHSVMTEDTFQTTQQNLFQNMTRDIALQRCQELQSESLDATLLEGFKNKFARMLSDAHNNLPSLSALILATEALLEDPSPAALAQYRAQWASPSTSRSNLFAPVTPAQALAAELAQALAPAPGLAPG